mgnify:FL=1
MSEHTTLRTQEKSGGDGSVTQESQPNKNINVNNVGYLYQVYILVHREYTLAYRDPFLYYFQLILLVSFALMIGAVFWDLPFEVDGNFGRISGGLLWIVMPFCW